MEEFLNHFERLGYYVFESFVTETEARSILSELKQTQEEQEFKKAGIGKQDSFHINKTERGDFIHWIDKESAKPVTANFLHRLDEIIQLLNRNFYLGIRGYECHYTEYPEGTFYKKHVDRHKTGSARLVSFVFYLNQDWTESDGGQLRIYHEDQEKDILPKAARLALFLSEKEHEVLLTNRTRNSITGWMLNEDRI